MIIRAKYAVLNAGQVLEDVRIELSGTRIVAITSGYVPGALVPDFNFTTGVVFPGLINPHCHLELEFCSGKVPYNDSFVDWLQAIRDMKKERGNAATAYPEASLAQLAAVGCTTVVDHYNTDLEIERIRQFGLRYVPVREYFDFANHSPDAATLRDLKGGTCGPHAPYSASLEVARCCRQICDEIGLPLSVHLSEFPSEIDFVTGGQSEQIDKLLKLAGQHDPAWQGAGLGPVAHYAQAGILDGPTYAIHVNYPQAGDIELLRDHGTTVVFCPRSHTFFRHTTHPIADYLAAGIPVALGTDSLASNAMLSPLYEAGLVREKYPQIPAEDVLRGITTAGLGPLGWDKHLGELQIGYLADLAVFETDGDPGRELAGLLDAAIDCGEASLTVAQGKVVHQAINLPRRQSA